MIEEFLKGIEVSVFVLTDGKSYKILPEAKDYKRIGEGDSGLNTGGMGAISPVPFAEMAAICQQLSDRGLHGTVDGSMVMELARAAELGRHLGEKIKCLVGCHCVHVISSLSCQTTGVNPAFSAKTR